MNHIVCHPERKTAICGANCRMESKDPMLLECATGSDRNFRIAIRFFDEHDAERVPLSSREAPAPTTV